MGDHIIQMSDVFCNQQRHSNELIKTLCLNPQCSESSTLCSKCLIRTHLSCRSQVFELEEIPQQLNGLQQLKLAIEALQNKINHEFKKLLVIIEQSLLPISKYQDCPNFTNLNEIGLLLRKNPKQNISNTIDQTITQIKLLLDNHDCQLGIAQQYKQSVKFLPIDPINKYNSDPNQGEQTQNQQQTEKKSQKKQCDPEYNQLINILNKAIIDNLKLLHQQLKQIDLSEYTIQNILNLMKQEAKPEDLLKIFQEIQKLFDRNSEMSKLFDLIIIDIPKEISRINLSGIIKSQIQNDEIQRLRDYIEYLQTVDEKQQQQQQSIKTSVQNQSSKKSENDQKENLKYQTILKHLKLLFKQLNGNYIFDESTYQQIIQKMMQEIQIEDLLSIFKDIYQLFPTNSQIYLFFYRILQAIKQENSKISLSGICRSKIEDNQITQLQNYILALEQRISRQETQNQQQIDKISQQKQQGLENNLQTSIINKALIEKLKLLLEELLYQELYENEIQNILNSMKQDTKPENLIIIFQEISKLFDRNSEMSKLFNLIIQNIPERLVKIYISGIKRFKIEADEIKRLANYIKKLEVEGKMQI